MSTIPNLPGRPRDRNRFFPITVLQYHRMIEGGILPSGSPVELLDGFLVLKDRSKSGEDPMSIGPEHASVVDTLGDALAEPLKAYGCRVRLQQPVTLGSNGEPEPDAAIVRDQEHRYRSHHPGANDIFCVVEVADSSLEHDRTTKLRIYAEAGIAQYVIVNLPENVIEVYQEPHVEGRRYGQLTTLTPDQIIQFSCGQGSAIPVLVGQLLP